MRPFAANIAALNSAWYSVSQSWARAQQEWTDEFGVATTVFMARLESQSMVTMNSLDRLATDASILWNEMQSQESSL
jgi:hypothetical protein